MATSLFGETDKRGRPTAFGKIVKPSEQWLALGPDEDILDPELPIVDAHHHLWDNPGDRYLINEFSADIGGGHNVVSTVYNECMSMYRAFGPEQLRPLGETEFVAGVGAMSDSGQYGPTRVAEGIVGFADLRLGSAVKEVLEGHIAVGSGRFKGTRFAAGWDDDAEIPNSHTADRPNQLGDEAVRTGVRVLADLGLSLDVMVFFHQLGEVAALADAFPDLTIVVGHCGGPLGHGPYAGRRDEVFDLWSRGIRDLAQRPNVVIKVGGVLARLAAFDYLTAEVPPGSEQLAQVWSPYFLTCIEAFGADRTMFESNFPVDKMGVGYTVLWNSFKRVTQGASADERRAAFAGTAQRVYRLSGSPS